jgi:hypothetical protein
MTRLEKLKEDRRKLAQEQASLLRTITTAQRRLLKVQGELKAKGAAIKGKWPTVAPLSLAAWAEIIFRAHNGEPMTVEEVTREMEEVGVTSTGPRLGVVVYNALYTNALFVRRLDRLWQLAEDAPKLDRDIWEATAPGRVKGR